MKLIKRLKSGFGETYFKKALAELDEDKDLYITPDGWKACPRGFKEDYCHIIKFPNIGWKEIDERSKVVTGAYCVSVWYMSHPNSEPQYKIWAYEED